MNKNIRRLTLFVFIYLLTFLIFRFNATAQTPQPVVPAPAADSAAHPATETAVAPAAAPKKNFKKIFAVFDTSAGTFKARLFFSQAPKTVENFIALAEGRKVWLDPATKNTKTNVPFYNGLTFHMVRKGIMIITGDPTGKGSGGSGFKIQDEFHPDLTHDKAGMLSMANRGRDTAESQFFITLAPLKHLNKVNAVFGEVIEGMDVVNKIGNAPVRRSDDRPKNPVVINKVTIIRE